jgi:hypothetical protein
LIVNVVPDAQPGRQLEFLRRAPVRSRVAKLELNGGKPDRSAGGELHGPPMRNSPVRIMHVSAFTF